MPQDRSARVVLSLARVTPAHPSLEATVLATTETTLRALTPGTSPTPRHSPRWLDLRHSSQYSHTVVGKLEGKASLPVSLQDLRRSLDNLGHANAVVRVCVRRGEVSQVCLRARANVGEVDSQRHIRPVRRVIHRSLENVTPTILILPRHPIQRSRRRTRRDLSRRREPRVAQQLNHIPRRREASVRLLGVEVDEIGAPLFGVDVGEDRGVGGAEDFAGVALGADGEDGFGDGADPEGVGEERGIPVYAAGGVGVDGGVLADEGER